jgi:SAM-dependent methyltransferase
MSFFARRQPAEDQLSFTCNVCGTPVTCPVEQISREVASCPTCGSTVRMRSIVHLVSLAVLGRSVPLPDFPVDKSIVGLGLSDWPGYANRLAEKFSYTNTFFHEEPLLDITAPAPERRGSCDFVISTDVFEHVLVPVSRAFKGAYDLLKPGGHLIFTVPFTNDAETVEHFPEIHDFRVVQFGDEHVLVNRTADGRYTLHTGLVFHGGPGTTLEMRVFCRSDVERHLAEAGFTDIHVMEEAAPQWGILHKHPWSLPVLARKPA